MYATEEDYRPIERAIIELDHPVPEVSIEAIAAEVTLNDTLNYGVQYFLQGALGSSTTGNLLPFSGGQQSAALPLATTVPGANLLLGIAG